MKKFVAVLAVSALLFIALITPELVVPSIAHEKPYPQAPASPKPSATPPSPSPVSHDCHDFTASRAMPSRLCFTVPAQTLTAEYIGAAINVSASLQCGVSPSTYFGKPTYTRVTWTEFAALPRGPPFYYMVNMLPTGPTAELSNPAFAPVLSALPLPTGDRVRLLSVLLWVSRWGSNSGLHADRRDMMHVVTQGTKRFVIFPKADSEFMYPDPDPNNPHFSLADLGRPDALSQWPLLAKAHPLYFNLSAGDMLFIPSLWWHQAFTEEATTVGLAYQVIVS